MDKFYENIETIRCDYLLKATPYSKENTLSFDDKLNKELFFTELYTERSTDPGTSVENDLFDKKIDTAIKDLGNKFAKVSVLHISGYAGCGKTTYIHHLLWTKRDEIGRYDVIDYEGCKKAIEPFVDRAAILLAKHYSLDEVCNYFDAISANDDNRVFVMSRFMDCVPEIHNFSIELRRFKNTKTVNKDTINDFINSFGNRFEKEVDFLRFLFIIEFFLLLLNRFIKNHTSPIVIVIDNSDSIGSLSEEEILLPATMQFAKDCNFFFVTNIDRQTSFMDKTVSEVCKNTKLQIIFTTRLVTERRYEVVSPDWEKIYGWTSIKLPENYYNHLETITKRVNYYLKAENSKSLQVGSALWKLVQIKKLAEVAYHSPSFMRLFNGSLRVCIDRLFDITQNYPEQMVHEVIDLYSKASRNTDTYEGAVGYFMSLVIDTFKHHGIYSQKLELSPCRKDGTVTLSRIILTVLREKGGRCSLLDIFKLLTPLGFSSEKIAQTVWNLCEANRDVWRRLIVFEMIVPTTVYKFVEQADMYEKGNNDVEDYTEIVMCTAGNAYLEFVLPHFEFLQSRHELAGSITEKRYQPLFADSSEEIIIDGKTSRYRFDVKIERVFKDVSDCCYNSLTFANTAMRVYKWDREMYINRSFFNYHPIGWDGGMAPRQSYESRLIFRHVGYIEKYRRYLLKKYAQEDLKKKIEISEILVAWIIKYLELYQDSEKCFHTPAQDSAAVELILLAKGIHNSVNSSRYDLITRIEIR